MAEAVPITRQVGRPSLVELSLAEWLKDVAEWARAWQIKNGRFTSAANSSINSYEVFVTKNKVRLFAAPWTPFALQGRNAGKRPPIAAILDWIERKPIRISGDESPLSVAFAIATGIENKGTAQPRLKPQNINVVINNFGKKHLKTLGDELAEQVADELFAKLKR